MSDIILGSFRNNLSTIFIGKKVYRYNSVGSTMDIARKLAREKAEDGTVIIADRQWAGKGRLGRTWLSPDNNLAMSIILYPAFDNLFSLIMVASVAVVRALKKVAKIDAQIKWPNDIMIQNKKVCGILIENELKGSDVEFSIVGIGLNINLNSSKFPEIAEIATSIFDQLGREISEDNLACMVLCEFEKLYLQSRSGNSVYLEWQGHMETIGKMVTAQSGKTILCGLAKSVTEKGNLVLSLPDGSTIEIVSADVTVLKK